MEMIFSYYVQFFIVYVNMASVRMDTIETKSSIKKSYGSLLKNIIDVNEKRLAAMKKINDLQDFIMTKNKLSKIHDYDNIIENDSAEEQHAILTLVDMKSDIKLRRKYTKYQNAPSNNLNIIIPFNSFNIKADYKNYENNGRTNDETKKYNDNDKKDKKMYSNDEVDIIIDYNGKIHNRIDYNGIRNRKVINNFEIEDKHEENKDIDKENTDTRRNWRGSCDKKAAKVCKKACVSAHKNVCMLFKCSRRAKKAFSKECKRSCKEKFVTGQYSDSDYEWE